MAINEMSIADGIISWALQAPEWTQIERNSPEIQAINRYFDELIADLPGEVSEELKEVVLDLNYAYVDIAMLYGIQIANAINAAANAPERYSQYLQERMKEIRAARK